MARPRAVDYETKRRAILKTAALLFAQRGVDRTSLSEVAEACGISKALLYHYHNSKEILLFDIIRDHLDDLLDAVRSVPVKGFEPRQRLEQLAKVLLEAYRDADAEHQVQIGALKTLAEERQREIKELERELVRIFSEAIAAVRPSLAADGAHLLKPITMSLFGMLNWHYLWFRPNGPISREDYASLAVKLVVDGTRDLPEGMARQATS